MGMRILWSAVSLLVVAGLALLLWNAASGTDRVEVVRGGVSVSGSPAPDPSAGTAPPAGDPSSSPSPTGPAQDGGDAPGPDTGDAGGSAVPVPPVEPPPAPPAPPAAPDPAPPAAPAPPAQVPLPVQPAPLDDDWDDDVDD